MSDDMEWQVAPEDPQRGSQKPLPKRQRGQWLESKAGFPLSSRNWCQIMSPGRPQETWQSALHEVKNLTMSRGLLASKLSLRGGPSSRKTSDKELNSLTKMSAAEWKNY